MFTSPPYFNTEKYSEDDTQSWVRYKKIDDWNEKFLHTTLGKIIPTIKKNGILAINIADVFNAPINDYVEITNPMNDFIKSKGLEYLGCIGMEMTKRFNSGGEVMPRVNISRKTSKKLPRKLKMLRLQNQFGYGKNPKLFSIQR